MNKCTYQVKDAERVTVVIDRRGVKGYETLDLPAKICKKDGIVRFTQSMTGETVTLCKTHATDAAFRTALERGYTHEAIDSKVEI